MSTRHHQLEDLFCEACVLPPKQWEAYLTRACSDAELRREVLALLEGELGAPTFLEGTALADHGPLLAPTSAPPPLPDHIGSYAVLGVLGQGGMGVVYRARQLRPAREVAIKVLLPGRWDPEHLHRFEEEGELLGQLQHPGIARIYEAGFFEWQGTRLPYLVMELIRGEPLGLYIQRTKIGLRDRLQLLLRIAAAVEHAHQRGVVHRDLKPGNILVDEGGEPKILDFGVSARMAPRSGEAPKSEALLGTLPYLAPELLDHRGGPIDPRVDLYALGVLLYELCSGELPIAPEDTTPAGFLLALREGRARPLAAIAPHLPRDLGVITTRALEPDPEQRYDSVASFAEDLRRFVAREPIRARKHTPTYLLACFIRRNPRLLSTILISATLLIAFAAAFARKSIEAARNSARVDRVRSFLSGEIGDLFTPTGELAVIPRESVSQALSGILSRAEDQLAATPGDLAQVLLELARAHTSRWQLAQAELVTRRALQLGDDQFGPLSRFSLDASNDLVLLLRDQGRFEEAFSLLEERLEAAIQRYGENDPQLLMLRHNRALLNKDRGEFAAAEAEYRAVLAQHKLLFGANSPEVRSNEAGLAEVLMTRGDTSEAIELSEHILAGPQGTSPEERGDRLTTMERLASLYRESGRLEAARSLLEEAVTGRMVLNGPEHDYTLAAQYGLARVLTDTGELEDAERILRGSLETCLQINGPNHPSTGFLRTELGRCLRLQGRLEEAEAELLAADALRTHLYPAGSVVVGFGRVELARIQAEAGRPEAALKTFDAALSVLEGSLAEDNWRLCVVRAERAHLLVDLGRAAEALPILQHARARVSAALSSEPEWSERLREWEAQAETVLSDRVSGDSPRD